MSRRAFDHFQNTENGETEDTVHLDRFGATVLGSVVAHSSNDLQYCSAVVGLCCTFGVRMHSYWQEE